LKNQPYFQEDLMVPRYRWQNRRSNGVMKHYSSVVIIIIIIIIIISCHRPFLPGTSLEPAVTPTAQASSFTLQYFLYYVCDDPSIAVFCSESIECFPDVASRVFFKLYYY
jgi:hypothetical protein